MRAVVVAFGGGGCSTDSLHAQDSAGVVPRFLDVVLEHARDNCIEWSMAVSFVELHNEELRDLLGECVRLGWLPASFDVKRISGISLRRGGNFAAAAAGVSNLMRAAQGRWLCTETPDQSYTMLHRTEHVELATTIFEGRT